MLTTRCWSREDDRTRTEQKKGEVYQSMPRGIVDEQELKLLRVFPRKLPSGKISYVSFMNLWVADPRILEVDRALQKLRERRPNVSLSSLVCDAIVQSAAGSSKV